VKFTPLVERSTVNPVSFAELLCQVSVIWSLEMPVAFRFVGAAGSTTPANNP
jgi:hypothetical protein